MGNDWRQTTLGEVIELKRGYDLPQQNRRPGLIPVVSSSGISDYHAESMVRGPGVVTGRYGTIGKVFYIRGAYWPLNTALYVRDFKGNDPRFISYFLRSVDFRAYSDKAAVPGLNRNHLHQALVKCPPLQEQRAIAHILGTMDDKIELNRRMNETLEAMARAIFKSWFVDFDSVRAKSEGRDPGLPSHLAALFPDHFQDSELGEMPAGWEVKALDQIANFLNGLALQKFPPTGEDSLPVIKIAQLRAGSTEGADRANRQLPKEYVVRDGDVLFSWSGSLEVRVWCGGEGALNQHLFKVTSAKYPKWFYLHAILLYLEDFRHIAAGKATTMGHIQRHHLSDAKVAVPGQSLLDVASKVMAPLIDQITQRRIESRTLATLRDALLPPLLSGVIRVPIRSDAETMPCH